MKRLHILLLLSSLTLIALSINRLSSLFLGYLSPMGFLRWVDWNAMLPIPIAIIVVYFLIKHNVETEGKPNRHKWSIWLNVFFIVGIYIYGASSGNHETTNYLHGRFCDQQTSLGKVCDIIAYHDSIFSHYLYYLGFVLLTGVLLVTEWLHPRKYSITKRDIGLILCNSLIIAAAVFANLAFSPAVIDIAAFSILALISLAGLVKNKQHVRNYPITIYLAAAYSTGLIATVLYKFF